MSARGFVAAAVLAAWGAGIAVFVQREMSRSPAQRLAESAMRVSPGASYYAVEDGARHVGFASFTTDTIPEGLQFTEYLVREGAGAGPAGRQVREVVGRATRALVLREAVVIAGVPVATARVADDSTLVIMREGADGRGPDSVRTRFAAPLLLPSLVPMAVALGSPPRVGDRHAWDVFDPASLRVRRLGVSVRAESTWMVLDSAAYDAGARRWRGAHVDTVHAWRVVEDAPEGEPRDAQDQRVDAWVDELGRVVAARTGTATLRRASYELAFENWRGAARGADRLPSPGLAGLKGARMAPGLDALTMVAKGLPLDRLAVSTEWQAVRGDTVRIVAPAPSGRPNGYWLPPQRSFRAEHARDLQVEPGLEVESPLVAATSRRLRGAEVEPMAFARALVRWVSDSIRLEPTPSPPSALTTLRSLAGDADHHTVAFVALARASGLPSRAVRGLLRTGNDWMSHSWAEVFVGGLWLPVDPTTGQAPVDAAHVRLLVGGVTLAPELDRLVSRATLQVLSSSVKPAPPGGAGPALPSQP